VERPQLPRFRVRAPFLEQADRLGILVPGFLQVPLSPSEVPEALVRYRAVGDESPTAGKEDRNFEVLGGEEVVSLERREFGIQQSLGVENIRVL